MRSRYTLANPPALTSPRRPSATMPRSKVQASSETRSGVGSRMACWGYSSAKLGGREEGRRGPREPQRRAELPREPRVVADAIEPERGREAKPVAEEGRVLGERHRQLWSLSG